MSLRRPSKFFRWLKLLLLAIIFSAFLAGTIWFVWYSPVFTITGTEVKGATISNDELNDLLGGNPAGQNIIFWHQGAGHTLDPRFSSMMIAKNYFSRTIEVNVQERDKEMVWCFESNQACYWVDKTGFIFDQAPLFSGSLVTVITDSRTTPLDIGGYVLNSPMNAILHSILQIISRLGIQYDEVRLEDLSLRELSIKVQNGPRIIFSLDIDPAFTETAIASLMKTSQWSKIKSLNLTVPDRAYPSF